MSTWSHRGSRKPSINHGITALGKASKLNMLASTAELNSVAILGPGDKQCRKNCIQVGVASPGRPSIELV